SRDRGVHRQGLARGHAGSQARGAAVVRAAARRRPRTRAPSDVGLSRHARAHRTPQRVCQPSRLSQRREAIRMSVAGLGAVVIWHDIAPEGRQAFYAWHGREHMPERPGIPGFLRGRRYVAEGADGPEFFNLYETVSPCTASGAEYRMRLDSPTPWTQATVRHFRNVSRSLCAVAAS